MNFQPLADALGTFGFLALAALFGFIVLLILSFILLKRSLQKTLIERVQSAFSEQNRTNAENMNSLRSFILTGHSALRKELLQQIQSFKEDERGAFSEFKSDLQTISQANQAVRDTLSGTLSQYRTDLAGNFLILQKNTQDAFSGLSGAMQEKLDSMRKSNEEKLEVMRQTVDEKLQATLESRLGESFRLVSEQLLKVQEGLVEMRRLAGEVGDLKGVLTNVKTRGTFGEVQLGAILEDMLAPDQFAKNVRTVPGSACPVEFAVRLPGSGPAPVWLPIDSKFPMEDFQRLEACRQNNDAKGAAEAVKSLTNRVKSMARDIHEKYIHVPETTEFGILFLPTESLYAEVLRIDGLAQEVQNKYRVVISGPAVMAALLNSLRMGFKTLAISRRSEELWSMLLKVKGDFERFSREIEATQKQVDRVRDSLENMQRTTKSLNRKLDGMETLPKMQGRSELRALTEEK